MINRQYRTPKCPFKICRCFILGYFNGVILVIDHFPATFDQQCHIISDFFPLIALIIGILNFVRLSEDIFKSLPCNVDFCRSIQRQIRNVKQDMTIFHLLDQIVQQTFCNIHIVGGQRCASTKHLILLHNRLCACCGFCKFFCQNMFCRYDDQTSAFALKHTRYTEVSHIHITIIQEIISFFVVVFASFSDLFLVKRKLSRGGSSPFSQVKNIINNFFQVIAGIGGMSPQSKFNSAQFRGTCTPL